MSSLSSLFPAFALPFSVEMFPPKGQLTLDAARTVAAGLAQARPSFVSVTCSAGGSGNSAQTVDIAALLQNEFAIPGIAHLTCVGATRASLDQQVRRMREAGITTVLALRGDMAEGQEPGDFLYAKDIIPLLKQEGFTVGAAAYPEGHISCFSAADNLWHLKEKQEAGADFFVTQLCFDNDVLLRFCRQAKKAGVTAPITCGIMPFLAKSQLQRMVFLCGSSLPAPIIKLLAKHEDSPEELRQAGIRYACQQLVGLAQAGVDGLHVYAMNQPDIALAAAEVLVAEGLR